MTKRINIVLPRKNHIQTMDRMAKPGQRSRFIDTAVRHFLSHGSTEALRTRLERATVRDRDLDRRIASDWFAVDKEAWQQLETNERREVHATRGGVKSTSRRFDPAIGGKYEKTRPALIIQNDVSNRLSEVTIVAHDHVDGTFSA